MLKSLVALAAVAALAGCTDGRFQPFGSLGDPVCLKDGSVAFYQEAGTDGKLGQPVARKEYCPWNKSAKP